MVELIETEQYATSADRIYGCALTQCPLHARIDQPGCFPKFGAGGRTNVRLALITMNPGAPDAAQLRWKRHGLDRLAMHAQYEQGLLAYHRQSRGGGVDLRGAVRAAGLDWPSVYYTEVAKCVTAEPDKTSGVRARALTVCSDAYLGDELEALLPTLRAVITLGGDAYVHTVRAMKESEPLRHLVKSGAVIQSPHPAAFGQRFRHEFPSILASLKELFARIDDPSV